MPCFKVFFGSIGIPLEKDTIQSYPRLSFIMPKIFFGRLEVTAIAFFFKSLPCDRKRVQPGTLVHVPGEVGHVMKTIFLLEITNGN